MRTFKFNDQGNGELGLTKGCYIELVKILDHTWRVRLLNGLKVEYEQRIDDSPEFKSAARQAMIADIDGHIEFLRELRRRIEE